jgi:hypothetical protein
MKKAATTQKLLKMLVLVQLLLGGFGHFLLSVAVAPPA